MKSQRNPAPDAAVEAIKAVWEAMRRYGDPNDHALALAAINVLSVNRAQATDARVESKDVRFAGEIAAALYERDKRIAELEAGLSTQGENNV